ncbi:MAG: OmpA family protein [Rhodanobacteraceae bacterium]
MKTKNCLIYLAILLGIVVLTPARAADGKDCPPIGSLPGYVFYNAHQHHAYDSVTFPTDKGDVAVAGEFCEQDYQPKDGTQPMSKLERQMNYRSQLDQLGATVVGTDGYDTYAKLVKDGKVSWIKVILSGNSITVTVVDQQPFKQSFIDTPSVGDYAPLGHMPDYIVEGTPKKENFDQATFTIKSGDSSKDLTVQGSRYQVGYRLKDGAPRPTKLEIMTNYENALKKLGGQILYTESGGTVTCRLDKQGQPVWIHVDLSGGSIYLDVIEEKVFLASIKPPQASAMKTALDRDGHIALDIHFDFDKATLRPDSQPVIAQVEALLKDNSDLKLSIQGNTDNVGDHDYNVKLSQRRAASVVTTLVEGGIAADRLTSAGNGPDKPVADNDTTAGRAKNRRVELVKL